MFHFQEQNILRLGTSQTCHAPRQYRKLENRPMHDIEGETREKIRR